MRAPRRDPGTWPGTDWHEMRPAPACPPDPPTVYEAENSITDGLVDKNGKPINRTSERPTIPFGFQRSARA